MFENILIPTDGSELAEKAAAYGVALAKKLGAKVTVVTVTTPWQSMTIGDVSVIKDPDEYERHATAEADTHLHVVAKRATEENVACDVLHVRNALPWHGIIETAELKGCDMIVMASHGRRGLSAMLLGSETQKVLRQSHVPVLIYR